MHSPSLQLQLDGAQLIDAGLTNSSWERGFNGGRRSTGRPRRARSTRPRSRGTAGTSASSAPARHSSRSPRTSRSPPSRARATRSRCGCAPPAAPRSPAGWCCGRCGGDAGVRRRHGVHRRRRVAARERRPLSVATGGHTRAALGGAPRHARRRPVPSTARSSSTTGLANAGVRARATSAAGTRSRAGRSPPPRAAAGSARDGSGVGVDRAPTPPAARSPRTCRWRPARARATTFSAWVRSPSGKPVSGSLVLRGLGGPGGDGPRRRSPIGSQLDADLGAAERRPRRTRRCGPRSCSTRPGQELARRRARRWPPATPATTRSSRPRSPRSRPRRPPAAPRADAVEVRALGDLLQVEQQPGQPHAAWCG